MIRAAVALVVALTAAALPAAAAARPAPVAGGRWKRVAPKRAGLKPAALQRIAGAAERGHSTCLAVAHDAHLAGEWEFAGRTPTSAQDIFSATKSVTSTLVGIAQDRGDLRIGDRAAKYIPAWRHTPADRVTIRDLLANDSGRQWSPLIDYRQLLAAPDRTAFAIGLGQASPPGTVWAYNNSAIQTLEQVLDAATGRDVARFAQRRLFGPLGMRHTEMTRDRAGNPQTFEGVRSTCRDLARFGTMMLDHGRWGRTRIVSRRWVDAATGRSSTSLNAAYGYLWWLNRYGHIAADPLVATSLSAAEDPQAKHGRLVADAPHDLYWALGLGNQIVQIDPGSRTVTVRLGTAAVRPRPPTFGPAQASRVVTDAVRGSGT